MVNKGDRDGGSTRTTTDPGGASGFF